MVLDNCEHLAEEAAALAGHLLARCPRLRILATSREPLAVTGEHLWQVRPLDSAAAVQLFTERASAVRRGFTASQGPVERICAALDHLPLAIELAAARLRTMDVEDLERRLDDRLGMAAARASRGAAERHRTLRAVVTWSWELLSEREQRAARRFTVCPAGATARAALEVCQAVSASQSGLPEPEVSAPEALRPQMPDPEALESEVLESLVDKSLLELAGGRLRMLETVRAYGVERLQEAGETSATRGAHARYVLELAHSETMIRWAMIGIMVRRLTRADPPHGPVHTSSHTPTRPQARSDQSNRPIAQPSGHGVERFTRHPRPTGPRRQLLGIRVPVATQNGAANGPRRAAAPFPQQRAPFPPDHSRWVCRIPSGPSPFRL
ncbi:ATP-binding protein [Streptomyces sp. NPDC053493]|uniref:ATP-binding protein n=1 Tax=Streptomyces sp. NPDC053493 TaxID=3365705 RepID=UPI0037CD9130